MVRHWIKKAFSKHKKGHLHFLLDVPPNKKIPLAKLKQVVSHRKNPLYLRRMAQLALNVRRRK